MGQARELLIEGPAGRLEAALRIASPARAAAVVAHPHPLHGGTLHNPVVFHADRELNRVGFHTLRFNFRGVGKSDGEHDGGDGEVQDMAAAVTWLRGLTGQMPLIAVGYSFGSICAIRQAASDPGVAAVIALGLPVKLYPAPEAATLKCPLAVVQAEHDEFGTPDDVRSRLTDLDPPAEIHEVANTTHLFPGHAPEVADQILRAAESLLITL